MEAPIAEPGGHGDRIGALPDGVLEDILGFLPAHESVRTSVLARRWRHLWKSSRALRVVGADGMFLGNLDDLGRFVDNLLASRGDAPLDTFDLRFGDSGECLLPDFPAEDLPSLNIWFRYAVACQARVLRFHPHNGFLTIPHALPELDASPLVSRHLTRLELRGVRVCSSFPDFSGCPALEHLEFVTCEFSSVKKISSETLKHLSITGSICGFSDSFRTRICAPNLVSLRLDAVFGTTPGIESMPSLVEAFVRIPEACGEQCEQWHADYWDCDCKSCDTHDTGHDDGRGYSVILKGLSEAKKLALFSHRVMYIFKRDLRCCPKFSKLKSLLLNKYWCELDDLRALACILEHSPILEELTLQLFYEVPKNVDEIKGSPGLTEISTSISEHLQIVVVKWEVVDHIVLNVLNFLRKLGIQFEQHDVLVEDVSVTN